MRKKILRKRDLYLNQMIAFQDTELIKVMTLSLIHISNVAFKLTSQTTGESHIVVTDENGEVRTTTEWNPHSQNTNRNDGVEDEAA